MRKQVVRIHPEETVAVAARVLGHNNVGAMPVCAAEEELCDMISLGDLARKEEGDIDTGEVLTQISSHLSDRK